MATKKDSGLSKTLRAGVSAADTGSTVTLTTVTAVPPDTITIEPPTITLTTVSAVPPDDTDPQPNPNCSSPNQAVDRQFISDNEGGQKLQGYVPVTNGAPNSNSGVTIATGVDLHGRTEASMQALGWGTDLINLLLPYTSPQGTAAQNLLNSNPLTVTQAQADLLDSTVMQQTIDAVASAYDAATSFTTFDRLPDNTQTAIADVAFQYGTNLASATPNFWNQITSGDWTAALANLRDFGDDYSTRRNAEANLLESDMNSYIMPTTENPCN